MSSANVATVPRSELAPSGFGSAATSGPPRASLAPSGPKGLPQLRVVEQNVLDATPDGFGVQRLLTHERVRVESINDGVHDLVLKIGRVGELLLGVVRGLLGQSGGLQQFPHQDIVYVDKLVLVREFALEQRVHLLDDFIESSALLLLHAACPRLDEGVEQRLLARLEQHRDLAVPLQCVVRELDLREVDVLALASELEEWQEALVEAGRTS